MARSTGQQLRRELAQILNHIDTAAYGLASLVRTFQDPHPDMAEYLEQICKQLLVLKEAALTFWEWAWGKRPEDYNTWR